VVAAAVLGRDARDAAGAVVKDRAVDVGVLKQRGARRDGVLRQHVVEVGAGTDEAVGREVGEVRPVHLERFGASAVDTQALVVEPAVLLRGVDAQSRECPRGAGGQAVAAHLLTRKLRLLQQRHVQPVLRQVGRGRRPSRAGPDDDDVRLRGSTFPRGTGERHEAAPQL